MNRIQLFLACFLWSLPAFAIDTGSANQVYVIPSAGGRAKFGQVDLSQSAAVKNQLPVSKGGTGAATLTLNGMLFGNGTSAVGATSAGSQYQVFQAGVSGVPTVGALNLAQSAAITGTLGHGNGGTDVTSPGAAGNVLISNGTNWISGTSGITSMFNIILGSSAQVTAGTATNSTFAGYSQADGDRILILPGYTTSEAWTITKKLYVYGLGNTSQVQGAITLNTGASYTVLENFRTTGDLTIASGVVGVFASKVWFSGTHTFVDNNSVPPSNYLTGMQE